MLPGDYSDVVSVGGDACSQSTWSRASCTPSIPNLAIIGTLTMSDPTPDPPMTHERVTRACRGTRTATARLRRGVPQPRDRRDLNGIKVVDITQLDRDAARGLAAGAGQRSGTSNWTRSRADCGWHGRNGLPRHRSGPARTGLVDANGDGTTTGSHGRASPPIRRSVSGSTIVARLPGDRQGAGDPDPGDRRISMARRDSRKSPSNPVVGLDFEHAVLRPVRRAKVVAKNSAGAVIGTTFTDEFGRYSLDVPKNTDLYIELWAGMGSASQNQLDIQVFKIEHFPGDPTANPPVPPTRPRRAAHTCCRGAHPYATVWRDWSSISRRRTTSRTGDAQLQGGREPPRRRVQPARHDLQRPAEDPCGRSARWSSSR